MFTDQQDRYNAVPTMLLQTNSYVVPRERRLEHARLLQQFRQTMARLGCHHFEVFEQVGGKPGGEGTGRYIQIMRFRDRRHQLAVQAAERSDLAAQALISEFCELINFPYQQQEGLFTVGFYSTALPAASSSTEDTEPEPIVIPAAEGAEPDEGIGSEELTVAPIDFDLPHDTLSPNGQRPIDEDTALAALGLVPDPFHPGESQNQPNGHPMPGQPGEDVLLEGFSDLEAEHDQPH